ncbi:MAG TPA: hypothetical protein VMS88_02550 [Terriglobales bacterium]|nr:hypothetical protein [Terriglobales bacterium]
MSTERPREHGMDPEAAEPFTHAGATDEAFAFLDRLGRRLDLDVSPTVPALREALLAHLRREQAALAANGIVHQLCARALEVTDGAAARGENAPAARVAIGQSCAAERADLESARSAVALTARALLVERGGWVATVGRSGTVSRALLGAREAGRGPRAIVSEARPRLSGRSLAAELAGAGVPVWLVVDAALPLLLAQVSMVWLGAEAVTDRGVIAPVGGYAAALAAREHSVPVYVLAARRKFLPAATPALRIDEMPAAEVWGAPPEGVRPRNVRAELVPLELLRAVIVEDGALGATETAVVARDRPLPEELAGAPAR